MVQEPAQVNVLETKVPLKTVFELVQITSMEKEICEDSS